MYTFSPAAVCPKCLKDHLRTPFCEKFSGGDMPLDPPRGSYPPGTRSTPTAYFKNLADYFQIYGEHWLYTLCCCQNEELA